MLFRRLLCVDAYRCLVYADIIGKHRYHQCLGHVSTQKRMAYRPPKNREVQKIMKSTKYGRQVAEREVARSALQADLKITAPHHSQDRDKMGAWN